MWKMGAVQIIIIIVYVVIIIIIIIIIIIKIERKLCSVNTEYRIMLKLKV